MFTNPKKIDYYIDYLRPYVDSRIISAFKSKDDLDGYLALGQVVEGFHTIDRYMNAGNYPMAEQQRVALAGMIKRVWDVQIDDNSFLVKIK